MQKITTFLSFDHTAEDAAKLYTSLFAGSRIVSTLRTPEGTPGYVAGTVLTVEIEVAGQRFILMNGGSHFNKFTDSVSLSIDCESQSEVDDLSEKLVANGGKQGPCGWVTDRFGVSWQVTPRQLTRLMQDKDPAKAKRVMQAMLKMTKIDIAALERAYAG
jgi:predicted 3-demethylubiquinone-9 3-methyltransferase (glyoxalase superfamily)